MPWRWICFLWKFRISHLNHYSFFLWTPMVSPFLPLLLVLCPLTLWPVSCLIPLYDLILLIRLTLSWSWISRSFDTRFTFFPVTGSFLLFKSHAGKSSYSSDSTNSLISSTSSSDSSPNFLVESSSSLLAIAFASLIPTPFRSASAKTVFLSPLRSLFAIQLYAWENCWRFAGQH